MERMRNFLFGFYKNAKYAIFPFFIFAILLAGCDDDNYSDCDGREIAFSPIPECMVDYFPTHAPVYCECEGQKSGTFNLSIEVITYPSALNDGYIDDKYFTWEKIDCNTISLSGEVSGTFEEMKVPEEGILEFVKNLSDKPVERVSCTCEHHLPCSYDM
jgi:hypothetical protein